VTAAMPWGARLLGVEGIRLVLASASPRRADLLRGLGLVFDILPVDVDEDLRPGEDPAAAAIRLAEAKAREAATRLTEPETTLVVGSDTLVVIDGLVLGKPADADDARAMLRRLSGRRHQVLTGVAVLRSGDGAVFSGVERTGVRFRELEEEDLGLLADSGEALDKAGAYGIQGLASLVVDGIDGDYFNVVGLPLGLLRRLVRRARWGSVAE
jgi:septum formation protein